MTWDYRLLPAAERDMMRLDRQTRQRIFDELDALIAIVDGPIQPPPSTKRMQNIKPLTWRLRVGDWRVLYRLDHSARMLNVLRVKHRGKAYR